MHPILASRSRLAIFIVAWLPLVALPVLALLRLGGSSWTGSALFALPLAGFHCFIALASWYSCKATPLKASSIGRVAATHLVGAMATTSVWSMAAVGLAALQSRFVLTHESTAAFARISRPYFAFGVVLYLLAVGLHYLITTFERSREVERRALELRVLARESELRALRAQIDPHFLFNSLNSISSLCGSDPGGARAMSILLADFLRRSLRIGSLESISVEEEIEQVRTYLQIEKIRFGDRLRFEILMEEDAAVMRVPGLILQPLVENAVKYGVEPLVGGGTIDISVTAPEGRIRLSILNEVDPERVTQGTQIGLRNVRRRLAATYGDDASLDTQSGESTFAVVIDLPPAVPQFEGIGE